MFHIIKLDRYVATTTFDFDEIKLFVHLQKVKKRVVNINGILKRFIFRYLISQMTKNFHYQ